MILHALRSASSSFRRVTLALLCAAATTGAVGCESSMVTRSRDASDVLRDFEVSKTPIPKEQVESAKAVAVLKEGSAGAGLAMGGGKGVMVQRTPQGWSPPIALDSTNTSLGVQIGAEGRQIVMIFRDDLEIQKVINSGGYSLADAAATLGPVDGSVGDTDNPMTTYVLVDGVYLGAKIGGVKFSVNQQVNNETYGMRYSTKDILAGKPERPLGLSSFYTLLPAPK